MERAHSSLACLSRPDHAGCYDIAAPSPRDRSHLTDLAIATAVAAPGRVSDSAPACDDGAVRPSPEARPDADPRHRRRWRRQRRRSDRRPPRLLRAHRRRRLRCSPAPNASSPASPTRGSRRPGSTPRTRPLSPPCAAPSASATSSTRSTPGSSCRSSTARSSPARTTSTWRCRCRGRHPEQPYALTGEKLGDAQFAKATEWEAARPAGAGRHRRRAGAVRRLRPPRRRRAVQRDRRGRRP